MAQACDFLPLGKEGAAKLQSLTWLSSISPASAWVWEAGPKDLRLSLLSIFKCPLQSLPSKLHISWDSVGCSFCSLEDWPGVPIGCMNKWIQLLPTLLPSSPAYLLTFLKLINLFLFSYFLIITIVTGVRWYLIVVLICISDNDN